MTTKETTTFDWRCHIDEAVDALHRSGLGYFADRIDAADDPITVYWRCTLLLELLLNEHFIDDKSSAFACCALNAVHNDTKSFAMEALKASEKGDA